MESEPDECENQLSIVVSTSEIAKLNNYELTNKSLHDKYRLCFNLITKAAMKFRKTFEGSRNGSTILMNHFKKYFKRLHELSNEAYWSDLILLNFQSKKNIRSVLDDCLFPKRYYFCDIRKNEEKTEFLKSLSFVNVTLPRSNDTIKMKPFECIIAPPQLAADHQSGLLINCGSEIVAMAWCRLHPRARNAAQILAIAIHRQLEETVFISDFGKDSSEIIMIYNCNSLKIGDVEPCVGHVEMVLVHPWGKTTALAWCPQPLPLVSRPQPLLGHLAVASIGDHGAVHLLPVLSARQPQRLVRISPTQPLLRLAMEGVSAVPTCICWPVPGRIVVGYSDGHVALFQLHHGHLDNHMKPRPPNCLSVSPSSVFNVKKDPIISIAASPMQPESVFAVSSLVDQFVSILNTDVTERPMLAVPKHLNKDPIFSAQVSWPSPGDCVLLASCSPSTQPEGLIVTPASLPARRGYRLPMQWLSSSAHNDALNCQLLGDRAGRLQLYSLNSLRMSPVLSSSAPSSHWRMPSTDKLVPLLQYSATRMTLPAPKCSQCGPYSECRQSLLGCSTLSYSSNVYPRSEPCPLAAVKLVLPNPNLTSCTFSAVALACGLVHIVPTPHFYTKDMDLLVSDSISAPLQIISTDLHSESLLPTNVPIEINNGRPRKYPPGTDYRAIYRREGRIYMLSKSQRRRQIGAVKPYKAIEDVPISNKCLQGTLEDFVKPNRKSASRLSIETDVETRSAKKSRLNSSISTDTTLSCFSTVRRSPRIARTPMMITEIDSASKNSGKHSSPSKHSNSQEIVSVQQSYHSVVPSSNSIGTVECSPQTLRQSLLKPMDPICQKSSELLQGSSHSGKTPNNVTVVEPGLSQVRVPEPHIPVTTPVKTNVPKKLFPIFNRSLVAASKVTNSPKLATPKSKKTLTKKSKHTKKPTLSENKQLDCSGIMTRYISKKVTSLQSSTKNTTANKNSQMQQSDMLQETVSSVMKLQSPAVTLTQSNLKRTPVLPYKTSQLVEKPINTQVAAVSVLGVEPNELDSGGESDSDVSNSSSLEITQEIHAEPEPTTEPKTNVRTRSMYRTMELSQNVDIDAMEDEFEEQPQPTVIAKLTTASPVYNVNKNLKPPTVDGPVKSSFENKPDLDKSKSSIRNVENPCLLSNKTQDLKSAVDPRLVLLESIDSVYKPGLKHARTSNDVDPNIISEEKRRKKQNISDILKSLMTDKPKVRISQPSETNERKSKAKDKKLDDLIPSVRLETIDHLVNTNLSETSSSFIKHTKGFVDQSEFSSVLSSDSDVSVCLDDKRSDNQKCKQFRNSNKHLNITFKPNSQLTSTPKSMYAVNRSNKLTVTETLSSSILKPEQPVGNLSQSKPGQSSKPNDNYNVDSSLLKRIRCSSESTDDDTCFKKPKLRTEKGSRSSEGTVIKHFDNNRAVQRTLRSMSSSTSTDNETSSKKLSPSFNDCQRLKSQNSSVSSLNARHSTRAGFNPEKSRTKNRKSLPVFASNSENESRNLPSRNLSNSTDSDKTMAVLGKPKATDNSVGGDKTKNKPYVYKKLMSDDISSISSLDLDITNDTNKEEKAKLTLKTKRQRLFESDTDENESKCSPPKITKTVTAKKGVRKKISKVASKSLNTPCTTDIESVASSKVCKKPKSKPNPPAINTNEDETATSSNNSVIKKNTIVTPTGASKKISKTAIRNCAPSIDPDVIVAVPKSKVKSKKPVKENDYLIPFAMRVQPPSTRIDAINDDDHLSTRSSVRVSAPAQKPPAPRLPGPKTIKKSNNSSVLDTLSVRSNCSKKSKVAATSFMDGILSAMRQKREELKMSHSDSAACTDQTPEPTIVRATIPIKSPKLTLPDNILTGLVKPSPLKRSAISRPEKSSRPIGSAEDSDNLNQIDDIVIPSSAAKRQEKSRECINMNQINKIVESAATEDSVSPELLQTFNPVRKSRNLNLSREFK